MPTDRPTIAELVEAVREYLSEQVAPNVDGQLAFHARVAANALTTVERTLAEGGDMDAREADRLAELLGARSDLESMNRDLAARIRGGEMQTQRAAVLDHLRQTCSDKLTLFNPRYLTQGDDARR